jgi:hypothetical protein
MRASKNKLMRNEPDVRPLPQREPKMNVRKGMFSTTNNVNNFIDMKLALKEIVKKKAIKKLKNKTL